MKQPTGWLARLDALARLAIPPSIAADDDQQRRALLLLSFALLFVVLVPVFLVLTLITYRLPSIAAVCVVGLGATLTTPVLLRRTGSLAIASSFIVGAMVIAVTLTVATVEGLTSSALAYLSIVPILATTVSGRRAGLWWMVACLMVIIGLVVADRGLGLLPNRELSVDARRAVSAWNCALLIVVAQLFALVGEVLRVRAMGALAAARDQLSATREQAMVNDRLASLGRMAAGVAHEINNPLTLVLTNVDHVLAELEAARAGRPFDVNGAERALRDAAVGARRVRDVVRDLKLLMRAGEDELRPVKLGDVVEASLRMVAAEARGRVTVERSLTEVPEVMANESQLGQVLLNLLSNAIEAMSRTDPALNLMRVSTGLEGAQVFVEVSDNGVGMSAETLSRIFDPFFTTRSVGQGMGLGLSICRSLVQAIGGRITVETTLGEGSRFRVYLEPASRTASNLKASARSG